MIARYMMMQEALMARAALEGANIEAMIDQPYGGTIVPHHQLFSGIALLVRESEAPAAVEILDLDGEDRG